MNYDDENEKDLELDSSLTTDEELDFEDELTNEEQDVEERIPNYYQNYADPSSSDAFKKVEDLRNNLQSIRRNKIEEKIQDKASEKAAQKVASKKIAQKAAQKETKAAAKKEVLSLAKKFLAKYWWVLLIIAGVILLIILLLFLISGSDNEEDEKFIDPAYAFELTQVIVTNSYNNEEDKIIIGEMPLEDFLMGAVYSEFNSISGKTDDDIKEIFKTYLVIAKSRALYIGGYNNVTKEITIQSGNEGMPYCDPYYGCNIVEANGKYTYVSKLYRGEFKGDVIRTISPMSLHLLGILQQAYEETKGQVLVPSDVYGIIENYDYGLVPYNQGIKNSILNKETGSTHEQIISSISDYSNYKIYKVEDYAPTFEYAESNTYWWPIGSASPDEKGLYSGTPTSLTVSSGFGYRSLGGGKFHYGLDISAACNSNVIIASRSGTVIETKGGCDTMGYYGSKCNSGYGNYVKIDHGNGVVTVYAHMALGSIVVNTGDKVSQGQKLGMVGSSGSSTGCHLHFSVIVNGQQVDPLTYISASNPRPASTISSNEFVSGSSNAQTVCLSLKQNGFSNNAISAIMTNIEYESGFNTESVGDSGTSYGICQWHNGRYDNLKSFCKDQYSTIKCQISFLISELKSSYKSVLNYLKTNNSAYDMASYYCINFEVPFDRFVVCPNRAKNRSGSYLNYASNGCK